ncbi:hypothetical protein DLJ53_34175 [Acuticoccus sediminis]|uniref:Antitoxin-like ribbon-helix-helix domain-containing protein n=1 Tax=Acuticoccus sediminis TaxID=2184697 RepID=A0A8B2NGS1_9HYPH|nr:ribbon-helix-helix domain-containing protein [Acuticoccus sediminis]RAH95661.1 hypothetical protein DLJ53_34175 [Acuticoccus sediminis]
MSSRFTKGLKSLGADEPKARKAMEREAPSADIPRAEAPETSAISYMAPSRRGKKAVTGYFDPAVRQQLAVLAAEEGRSQNDLLAEALNMLFERYRRSPIAKG